MQNEAVKTFLPPDAPDIIVGTASRNRWVVPSNGFGPRYILPDTISSAVKVISAENLTRDAWIVISDASRPDATERNFDGALPHLDLPATHPRIFVANRQTRRELINQIMKNTGGSYEVIKASVDGSGYGDNRDTLDNITTALSLASQHPIDQIAIDDDVILPLHPLMWRPNVLAALGITTIPNSQVVFAFPPGVDRDQFIEPRGDNSLKKFIKPLGQTVAQLRQQHPHIKVSELVIDTRPVAFEKALRGEAAQFTVSPEETELLDSDNGMIIATTEDKSGLPDYPTWIISKGYLENEFPQEEPVEAYPSGPKELYVGLRSETIFPDSAMFARRFDGSSVQNPAFWPWWHVSSLRYSKEYLMVESSFRSDNDFLPKWLKYIKEKTGILYLYASGIPTYAQHSRTPFGGDRRDAAEAAIASQIGNIAAVETFKRFEFPHEDTIYMRPIEENYSVPEDHAQIVYDRIQLLSQIAIKKTAELSDRLDNITDPNMQREIKRKINHYLTIISSLGRKMRGFDYRDWKTDLDKAIAAQLNFSRDWVATKPNVIFELGEIIRKGKYPIMEIKYQ